MCANPVWGFHLLFLTINGSRAFFYFAFFLLDVYIHLFSLVYHQFLLTLLPVLLSKSNIFIKYHTNIKRKKLYLFVFCEGACIME
jgi:hypothetical protein